MTGMPRKTAVRVRNNQEFADLVGIDYTMASRIRNGRRMPGTGTLSSIVEAFHIEGELLEELMRAVAEGAQSVGAFVREHLYVSSAADTDE